MRVYFYWATQLPGHILVLEYSTQNKRLLPPISKKAQAQGNQLALELTKAPGENLCDDFAINGPQLAQSFMKSCKGGGHVMFAFAFLGRYKERNSEH